MFIASVATLLIIAAVLGFALNVVFSGGFLARPPQGQNAVAIVIPFFGSITAGLAIILAGALCAVQARATAGALLGVSPALAATLVAGVTIGVSLLAFMVFILWVEPMSVSVKLRGLTVVLGWVGGVLGPLLLAAFLLACAWLLPGQSIDDGAGRTMFRVLVAALVVLSVVGYSLGGAGAYALLAERAKVRAAVLREKIEFNEKWDAHNSLPQAERVASELANMSASTPLWPIVSYMVPMPDQESLSAQTRTLIVERALGVPNLDEEMRVTMMARYSLYRQGAAELMIHTPAERFREHEAAWAGALVAGLDTVADRVACRPAWLSETFDLNPDPLGHIRSLLAAAERFHPGPHHVGIDAALKRLAASTNTLARDVKLEMLAKVMHQAGHPISN